MIDIAIDAIVCRLNQFFKNEFDLHEDAAVVSNILDLNGAQCVDIDSKVAVFVVNIEKETSPSPYLFKKMSDIDYTQNPPLHINLYIMFAACFSGKSYPEALKFISSTISFFQRNHVFNHINTPEMDEKIEKLIISMENISINDLSSLWGVLSGKYMPSVLYKVRMITFDAIDIKGESHVLRDADASVERR